MYTSIYHAVGLDEPLTIPAPFVNSDMDPQHYIDRYINESEYRAWFDANYPMYTSIYHAVGLDGADLQEYGYCGTGTKLINDVCTVVTTPQNPWWQFW